MLLATIVLLMITAPNPVQAGKRDKILLALAAGSALRNRDSVFRLIGPLRLVTEAWKHYGRLVAHQSHDYGHHHHHHGLLFGHLIDHLEP